MSDVLQQDAVTHQDMANALRFLAIDAVEAANSGHPGMPMGMADVATVLFTQFLKYDAADPAWPDRDRFVLSAGHGSMLLYGLLHLTGYPGMTIGEIKRFRQWGALTPGHPEYGHTPGVETTTGPLGQGIATAVGMALAERMHHARFGEGLVDHFTYVIAGDGCLMEGISQEAISLAGHLRLSRLIVLWDDNRISIDGATSLSCSDDHASRFAASGWRVTHIDGHDPLAIAAALHAARQSDRPSMIACRTRIGFGAPNREGSEKAHGAPLGAAEVAATRTALDWQHAPFVIPSAIAAHWRAAGARGQTARAAWQQRLDSAAPAIRAAFAASLSPALPAGYDAAMVSLREALLDEAPAIATRQASQRVLNAIAPSVPSLCGGSADLTHSNLTLAKSQTPVTPENFAGDYIHYGIREHAMAAAMNGIALHGGFIPYGGTFLVFADYSRPAIRLAALMGLRVIHVLTHDSIGLGEDGPTHQPVEHLAALRAIPGLQVFRPADAIETAEAWDLALRGPRLPSAICLSRQATPALRLRGPDGEAGAGGSENRSAMGAYVLQEPAGPRDVTLIASGTEVALARAAAALLAADGIAAAVVSAPCLELFDRQSESYRRAVLGRGPRLAIEAALEGNWAKYTGEDGGFIGMRGFGASAPAVELFRQFGITAEDAATAARRLIHAHTNAAP